MAALGQCGWRAIRSVCSKCGSIPMLQPRMGLAPRLPRRGFHSAPVHRGLISLLTGDTFQARLHKEIGKMLEDYDKTLLVCYRSATESVTNL